MIRQVLVTVLLAGLTVSASAAQLAERIVLFDGSDGSAFTHRDGEAVRWKVVEGGALEVAGGGGDIVSKEKFGDHVLHIEFMVPKLPEQVTGQNRGNSGVYVQGRYEVQVLDSFGLEPGKGDCGAIYGIKAPDRNASKPPGQWQSYDITFRAPRFDEQGSKTENARITVVHNGVTIHDDFELPSHTPGGVGGEAPEPGPLLLQDHGNPVRFRNIWVEPLAAPVAPATQSAIPPQRFDDLQPGLVAEYFRDVESLEGIDAAGQPFLVRIDKQLQFARVHGQFYYTKLNNNFAVRWSGVLRISRDGDYTLGLHSDDASRLFVGEKLVLENTRPGKSDAEASLYLAAGDYPVRIEYHQGDGSARFSFGWKPRGAKDWQDIPESQLLHRRDQAQIAWDEAAWQAYTWDRKAWLRDWAPKFEKMDYGPFLAHTIRINDESTVNKGIAIKLGDDSHDAAVLFDPELLCYAAGWTGGFLKLNGVVFDGAHGKNPSIDGQTFFVMPDQLGWSGHRDFADPRQERLGNIPRQRGHFKGMYVHENRVVLAYVVGGREILDMPAIVLEGGQPILRRTIEVGPSDRTIWLNMGPSIEPLGVAPSGQATLLRVEHSAQGSRGVEATTETRSPRELCAGGPARWPQVLVTTGTISHDDRHAYVVDTVAIPEENPWHSWMRFGGLDFFRDGTAALSTWSGDVWIVSGIDRDLKNVRWKRFATGLFQPLGLRIVEDQIYVLGRDQITRLHDLNNDGEADFYENFNNDCIVTDSFHEFALDLQTDPEGNFYFAKGGPVRPGGRGWEKITPHNGAVLKVAADGSRLEVYANGVRAPNGMGVGPRGEISVSDNEGTWTPACRVSFVRPGSFLGVVDLAHSESVPSEYDPPIYWLPHADVDNSSGGQVWSGDGWGPLSERMLHLSYGMCSLSLVLLDEVDGVAQGGIVKFPGLEFDTGICRARVNPVDGQVYVTGLKGWQTRGAGDGALHRVRYTGRPLYMPTKLSLGRGSITIGFSCELDEELAADPDSYAIEQWNYLWSSDYGSPKFRVSDPSREGKDDVAIQAVNVAPDRRSVTLEIPQLQPVMQMKVQMKLEAADGTPVEFDLFHTINRVPGRAGPSTRPTDTLKLPSR